MDAPIECLRCHTPMEPGFVADRTYGGWVEERWAPGRPDLHWWGMAEPTGRLPVTTLRCPRCGALESFAPPA
ncbi:MAG TPA: hypothetical protein VFW04_04320 [Gemmatimonadaceae bacterium]|nr:hypothetical protein [Gemmatimonadaceae bacterium]